MWNSALLEITLPHAAVYAIILGIIVDSTHQQVKSIIDVETRRHRNWLDELIPFAIAAFVVYLFYPITLFSMLPFAPRSPLADALLTTIFIGRGAGATRELLAYTRKLSSGIIDRLNGRR